MRNAIENIVQDAMANAFDNKDEQLAKE